MTDPEIVQALIDHDPKVTAKFFYKDCRPLLLSIIRKVFDSQIVDYDEIISELYIHLMEDDARRLRQFNFDSSLFQWLKTICIRHCLKLKAKNEVIETECNEPLCNSNREEDCVEMSQAKQDVEALLNQMKNQRYAKVIQMLMIDEKKPEDVAEALSVTVDNLYNIKRRAMAALADVALKDRMHYVRKQ